MPGSIERRGPNSYRLIVSDGYEESGKKRRITKTLKYPDTMTQAQQRKQCEQELALLYADSQRGSAVCSRQYTVREFAEEWLENYPPAAGLSPVTEHHYRHLLEGRIYEALGHIKLHQLTAKHLTRFYRDLLGQEGRGYRGKGKTLSASTVLHYHRVLSVMLDTAVKWGHIGSNPATNATTPKNDTKPIKVYTPEQTEILLEELKKAPLHHRVGVVLGVICQLRKGEAAGMNWADVDFERGSIRIERSAIAIPKQGKIIKSTKTPAGRRTITLPEDAMKLLRRLKAEQAERRLQLGESWVDSGGIFIQSNGERTHPDTLAKWFPEFAERIGLPRLTYHGLRHTGISLMFYNGEDAPTVAGRAGHGNSSVTLKVYAHAYEQKDRDAAARLEGLVVPKKGEKDKSVPK